VNAADVRRIADLKDLICNKFGAKVLQPYSFDKREHKFLDVVRRSKNFFHNLLLPYTPIGLANFFENRVRDHNVRKIEKVVECVLRQVPIPFGVHIRIACCQIECVLYVVGAGMMERELRSELLDYRLRELQIEIGYTVSPDSLWTVFQ
jgi:hypothetical protein